MRAQPQLREKIRRLVALGSSLELNRRLAQQVSGGIKEAARTRNFYLHRLKIANAGAGIGALTIGHRINKELIGALRRAERRRRQRMARSGNDRKAEQRSGVDRSAGMVEPAAAAR